MNPFERLAALLTDEKDPVQHRTQFNDITSMFEVELRGMNGRWAQGSDKDLAQATTNALEYWDDYGSFVHARATMAKTLKEDPDLYIGYQANVAMLLHDRYDGADFKVPETRDAAAKDLLKLIFEG